MSNKKETVSCLLRHEKGSLQTRKWLVKLAYKLTKPELENNYRFRHRGTRHSSFHSSVQFAQLLSWSPPRGTAILRAIARAFSL